MTEESDKQIDVDLLRRIARNASKRVTRSNPNITEDVEAELLLWAWEHRDAIKNYIIPGLPLRERENKLFVTLVRRGAKIVREVITENQTAGDYFFTSKAAEYLVKPDDGGIPHVSIPSQWKAMSRQRVIELLPFIHLQDSDVPRDYRLQVSVVRDAVATCTQAQQDVIRRLGRGMSYEEIAEDLGISAHSASKRFQRARLEERCDIPQWYSLS